MPQSDKHRNSFLLFVLIFLVSASAGLLIAWLIRSSEFKKNKTAVVKAEDAVRLRNSQNMNMLALGKTAKVNSVDISIQPPIELDFKSKAEILELRREETERHSELLANDYNPSDAVFGQIVDSLPWWGIEGEFYYGRGDKSITGASEESRFIVNPYLLVAAEFNAGWQGLITEADLHSFPLYCIPRDLRWRPQEAYAEVTYDASCIAMRQIVPFELIAYNARDLNLNYIFVSYKDSYNVSKKDAPVTAYANPQFIHQGGSCGYPGGCNNMSPATPDIEEIKITALPARVMIWLWKEYPVSLNQEPDMKFVIWFK